MKDEQESGYSKWGVLIPKGDGKPYVPPVYPEPKYKEGTKFKKWKLFDWNDTPPEQIDGNYLVDCVVGYKIWYDEKGQGWLYNVTPSEPIMVGDNYWNRYLSDSSSTSDRELDEYFKK